MQLDLLGLLNDTPVEPDVAEPPQPVQELDEEAIASYQAQAAEYLTEIISLMLSRELSSEIKRQRTLELHQARQQILDKLPHER